MLPKALLPFSRRAEGVTPHYLAPGDEVWVRAMRSELAALQGKTSREAAQAFAARVAERARASGASPHAVSGVWHVLLGRMGARDAGEGGAGARATGRVRRGRSHHVARSGARCRGAAPRRVARGHPRLPVRRSTREPGAQGADDHPVATRHHPSLQPCSSFKGCSSRQRSVRRPRDPTSGRSCGSRSSAVSCARTTTTARGLRITLSGPLSILPAHPEVRSVARVVRSGRRGHSWLVP